MPKLEAPSSYAARVVPPDEARVRLAELALRVNRSPAGKLILLDALSTRPRDSRILEVLGSEAYMEGDEHTAAERWEDAVAAGASNPAVVRELALMESRRWLEDFDASFRLPPELARRLRERLLRSIELEPGQGAAVEMLSWVEAFAELPDPKNINLVIARLPSLPDKRRTLVGLSMVMLRVGKPDQAVPMLDYLGKLQLEPREHRALGQLRDWLRDEFPNVSPAEVTGPSLPPPPSSPAMKTPSVGLPDEL